MVGPDLVAHSSAPGDLRSRAASFRRFLIAANLSPLTVKTYGEAVATFLAFATERGMPTTVSGVRREHVEAFITDQLERWKPATAANRYRGVQRFFAWLVEEGEIRTSPMAKMKPPKVVEQPPDVLADDDLRRLLATCDKSKAFVDRRDAAILRIFIDTGARLAEVAALRWAPAFPDENDVDLDGAQLRVVGKGGRMRLLPIGTKTARALDRYLLARERHTAAHLQGLWLGHRGALTASGIAQMVKERGLAAGLPGPPSAHLPPHLLPYLAGERRWRDRPHAPRRLAQSPDAPTLWRECGDRTGDRGPSAPEPRRSDLKSDHDGGGVSARATS